MTDHRAQGSSDQEAEWEAIRARGRNAYIWSHGVLRWGGFMLFFSLGVFQYAHFGHPFSFEGNWKLRFIAALLTWTFVGYAYGRSSWAKKSRDSKADR